MKIRVPFLIAIVGLLFVLGSYSANAQLTESTLKGFVLDATGSVVQHANVLATNESTGINRKAMSGDDGSFTVPDLPPGSYTLEVKAQGYKTFEQHNLQMNVGVTADANVRLEIGKVEETIQTPEDRAPLSPAKAPGQDAPRQG